MITSASGQDAVARVQGYQEKKICLGQEVYREVFVQPLSTLAIRCSRMTCLQMILTVQSVSRILYSDALVLFVREACAWPVADGVGPAQSRYRLLFRSGSHSYERRTVPLQHLPG